MAHSVTSPEALLRRLFDAAIAATVPAQCLPPYLPSLPDQGRIIVLGAGKAAAEMARVAETHWANDPGFARVSGLVITRYGHAVPTERVEVVEAAHPVPDDRGTEAASRILALAEDAEAGDLVICLLSGGGSALLSLPAPGISLTDKQNITRALLASGAPISEINCVRKHLSAIKGGRLATAAWPARVLTLAISDVTGDDPAVIASGPTVPDPTTAQQAYDILLRRRINVPECIRRHLLSGAAESPESTDFLPAASEFHVIANGLDGLNAATDLARSEGYEPLIQGAEIEGEAATIAREHAIQAKRLAAESRRMMLFSGGELTVTMGDARGYGGPNTEYALALALALDGAPGICAISCDTDGIDGIGPPDATAAGAVITPATLNRAAKMGWDAEGFLNHHESYAFFRKSGGLIVTGPTLTNVNDFRAILIAPS